MFIILSQYGYLPCPAACSAVILSVPYRWKYWREFNFRGWTLNRHYKNICGFKFGGSVRDRHTYIICKYEDFNLAVSR